jgi:hypothetical protein
MFNYSKWIIIFNRPIPQGFSSTKAICNKGFSGNSNILRLQLLDRQNLILLTDIHGKRILEQVVGSSSLLDMSGFKPGIYFLRVENTHGIQNIKVIKK